MLKSSELACLQIRKKDLEADHSGWLLLRILFYQAFRYMIKGNQVSILLCGAQILPF